MDFKVLIADSAIDDLKEIVEFVVKDNPEAAIRLGEKLVGHALNFGHDAAAVSFSRSASWNSENLPLALPDLLHL